MAVGLSMRPLLLRTLALGKRQIQSTTDDTDFTDQWSKNHPRNRCNPWLRVFSRVFPN